MAARIIHIAASKLELRGKKLDLDVEPVPKSRQRNNSAVWRMYNKLDRKWKGQEKLDRKLRTLKDFEIAGR